MNAAPSDTGVAEIDDQWMAAPALLIVLYIVSFYAFLDNGALSWSSFVLGAVLFGVLWSRHLFAGALQIPRLIVLPWLFLLLNVVSLLWVRDTARAFDELKAITSVTMATSAVWLALRNGVPQRIVLIGLLLGSFILVVASSGELASLGETGRLASLVGNANTLAMYLSYPSMLAWNMEGPHIGRWRLLSGGLVVFAFLFTGSRTMLLVLAAQLGFVVVHLLARSRDRLLWRRLGLAGAVLLASALVINRDAATDAAAAFFGANQVVARASRLDENREGSSVYIRERMVAVGLHLWAERPFAGHGAGQFSSLSGFTTYAHNNYVELLANDGILGLVLYYLVPGWMVVVALRWRGGPAFGFEARAHLIITVMALLILDVATVTIRSKGYWVVLAALAAMLEQKERADARG